MTARPLIAPRLAGMLILLAGAAAAGMSLVDGPSSAASPQVLLRDARGSIAIDQTRAGRAIVRGENIRPGEVLRGETVVENAGGSRARITLASADLRSSRGPGEVAFSEVLRLRVRRRTPSNPALGPITLYEGALGGMPAVKIGVWKPGGHHTFTFRVHYPDGGGTTGSTNAWQGASASLGFIWTASAPH